MSFEEIRSQVLRSIWMMNCQAEEGDVKRNHVNYGTLCAFGLVLESMGHRPELKNCYENDKGCLVMRIAKIDGKVIFEE